MNERDKRIFARTLYGEARGEYARVGIAAFIAVGNVIMNRQKQGGWFGTTITEVCLKPKQFSCWNEGDPNRALLERHDVEEHPLFKTIEEVADNLVSHRWPDLTQGCDHYHATSCMPVWGQGVRVKMRLGNHLFYQLEERKR